MQLYGRFMGSPVKVNNSIKDVASFLKDQKEVAITTHTGVDGDAVGSSVALLYLMQSLGAQAVFCHSEVIPPYLSWLLPEPPLKACPPDWPLLVVDSSRDDRVGVPHGDVALNLDHHEDNPLYGELNLVDPGAAASAQVVAALFRQLGLPYNLLAAEAIYTGMLTDTGGFRFRNISPEVHELTADLLRSGVVPADIYNRIYRSETVEQLNIIGVALARAARYGKVLISVVSAEDYRRCNATEQDSKGAIDYLRMVGGVEIIAHLRETSEGTKVSMRSETFDVGGVARRFGGGGHRLAAGYTSPHSPLEARDELLKALSGLVDLGGSDN